MSGFELQIPSDPLRLFDIDLQNFYRDVVQKEIGIFNRSKVSAIKQASKEIAEAYKKCSNNNNFICFDSKAKRCAYVMKHSPCFTSAVAKYMLDMARRIPEILLHALLNRDLHVCCLGGGPGTDIVAICKVISVIRMHLCIRHTFTIRITIVDLNDDWKTTADNVLKRITKKKDFFNDKEVKIHFDYCKADLTQPIEKEVEMALRKADLVTMVYFLSAVNKGLVRYESICMVQRIMKYMKEGSLLFYLDSASEENFRVMDTATKLSGETDLIYGPILEEFHTLSFESVKRFLELYSEFFFDHICLTNCFISVAAWYKPEDIANNRRLHNAHTLDSPISLDCSKLEKYDDLTAKMVDFRTEVQKLVSGHLNIDNTWLETEAWLQELKEADDFVESLVITEECVPSFFFKNKTKKRWIFTEHRVSI